MAGAGFGVSHGGVLGGRIGGGDTRGGDGDTGLTIITITTIIIRHTTIVSRAIPVRMTTTAAIHRGIRSRDQIPTAQRIRGDLRLIRRSLQTRATQIT